MRAFLYAREEVNPCHTNLNVPVLIPGCGRLANREQYCAEHQKGNGQNNYNQYERDPASNKRYGRAWKRIRDRYIKSHPLCEECENKDLPLPKRCTTSSRSPKGGGNERATSWLFVNPVTLESLSKAVTGGGNQISTTLLSGQRRGAPC